MGINFYYLGILLYIIIFSAWCIKSIIQNHKECKIIIIDNYLFISLCSYLLFLISIFVPYYSNIYIVNKILINVSNFSWQFFYSAMIIYFLKNAKSKYPFLPYLLSLILILWITSFYVWSFTKGVYIISFTNNNYSLCNIFIENIYQLSSQQKGLFIFISNIIFGLILLVFFCKKSFIKSKKSLKGINNKSLEYVLKRFDRQIAVGIFLGNQVLICCIALTKGILPTWILDIVLLVYILLNSSHIYLSLKHISHRSPQNW